MEEHNHDEEHMESEEELTTEEMVLYVDDKLEALLNLLVKKGVITEDEYDKEYEALFDEDDEEADEKAE